jgi:hypothetical protein
VVSNTKLATMASHTYKGNNTASSAAPIDLTATQLTAELNNFTSTLKGLVPLSGGGTTNFLRADATWAAIAAGITAGTGDVTFSGSGSVTTTLANIPNATPAAGSVLVTAVAAPGTPAAGKGSVYIDSTSKNLAVKDDAGTVSHTVQTKAVVANQFLTGVNDAGLFTGAQPAFTNISGTATIAQGGTGQTSAGAAFDALGTSTWTIAAAATVDLSTVAGPYGTVTGSGSVNVTSFGTVAAGVRKYLKVGAGLTLGFPYNSTSMLTPGGATGCVGSAGDLVEIVSLGSGNWQVVAVNNASIWVGTNDSTGAVGIMVAGSLGLQASGTSWITQFAFQHSARHLQKQGASVASATTITLGVDGNVFALTGTTAVTGITTTNWQAGSIVVLIPASASITLGHNTAAGGIRTKTGLAVAPVANNAYMLVYDGTTWDLL